MGLTLGNTYKLLKQVNDCKNTEELYGMLKEQMDNYPSNGNIKIAITTRIVFLSYLKIVNDCSSVKELKKMLEKPIHYAMSIKYDKNLRESIRERIDSLNEVHVIG